jgi:pimeloyl-ACP methyl ester carboxylesterase
MRCHLEESPWRSPIDIGFDEAGTGEALVLLPPFPLQRGIYAELLPRFAGLRRTFALDWPGFGDSSPAPPGGFHMDMLADWVAAFLDARRVPKATLLGVSLGGYVALAFAARHAARLAALVLADTRAQADSAENKAARAGALAALSEHGAPPFLDAFLPRLLAPTVSRDTFLRARLTCEERAASLAAAVEGLRDRPDRTSLLPSINVPCLVMVGSEDKASPPAEMQALAAAIPGALFHKIEGAGHLACFEAPDRFGAEVEAFLIRNGVKVPGELS